MYRSRFKVLSKHLFYATLVEALASEIQDFGNVEFHDSEVKPFVANLTFTINDFSNNFHKDNDYNSYVYGIQT